MLYATRDLLERKKQTHGIKVMMSRVRKGRRQARQRCIGLDGNAQLEDFRRLQPRHVQSPDGKEGLDTNSTQW